MPGTAAASASWMSSTVLMKCAWPRTKLVSSGFSTFSVMSCMWPSFVRSLQQQEQHDRRRRRPDAVAQAGGHVDPGAGLRLVAVVAQRHRRLAPEEVQDGGHRGGVFGKLLGLGEAE